MTVASETVSPAIETVGGLLRAFLDVLLPGSAGWPSASEVGVQHAMLMRLLSKGGESALASLTDVLTRYEAPYSRLSDQQKIEAVASLEAAEPELFAWLRSMALYAYYESPAVMAAINACGIPYRMDPHHEGYDLPAFDVEAQSPKHSRGHWIPTDAVKPVDISALNLDTQITEKWGLQR